MVWILRPSVNIAELYLVLLKRKLLDNLTDPKYTRQARFILGYVYEDVNVTSDILLVSKTKLLQCTF